MQSTKIKAFYASVAEEFGASKQSSMKDDNIRDLEVQTLIACLNALSCKTILEVGCGNGYAAKQIVEQGYKLVCIDFCEDLIQIAKQRQLTDATFEVGDVTSLRFQSKCFDLVFSERCLINLLSWSQQKTALNEIWRVLKPNGAYVMLEAFTDGLANLNLAREAVGLKALPVHWHNRYLNKDELKTFMENKFKEHPVLPFRATQNFLSSYYFGTRVIYHALIANRVQWIPNNKFDEFYSLLPAYGNYAPIQLLVLQKNG